MNNNFSTFLKKFFGIRTVKTGLATALALYIARGFDLKMPTMAALSAIVTMKNSIFDSFDVSKYRLLSTIIGGLMGVVFAYIGFLGFFPIIIGMVIIINMCNYFRWKDATTLSLMVFVMVMIYIPSEPDFMPHWQYAFHRLSDTFVGLVIGVLINTFIFRPNQTEFILKTYERSIYECESVLLNLLKGNKININRFISEIQTLNEDLRNIRNDGKVGSRYYIKIYKLSKMNSNFFSAFGLLSLLSESNVPTISESNQFYLEKYFRRKVEIVSNLSEINTESENDFNFYLEDLLDLMNGLKISITELKERLEHVEK